MITTKSIYMVKQLEVLEDRALQNLVPTFQAAKRSTTKSSSLLTRLLNHLYSQHVISTLQEWKTKI